MTASEWGIRRWTFYIVDGRLFWDWSQTWLLEAMKAIREMQRIKCDTQLQLDRTLLIATHQPSAHPCSDSCGIAANLAVCAQPLASTWLPRKKVGPRHQTPDSPNGCTYMTATQGKTTKVTRQISARKPTWDLRKSSHVVLSHYES